VIRSFGDWLAVLFVVAMVYVLVRPRSKAAELVEGFGKFVVALVSKATDLTSAG
jgi:hypothetical protein